MRKQLVSAVLLTLSFTALLGIAYPAVMTLIGLAAFPHQARGSLIEQGGRTVGSELIGQNFTQPNYFHGRPSAAGKDGYDALSSGGSNYGPTSKAMADRVKKTIEALKAEGTRAIPADLATASGSGLDPHISPAAAEFQVPRVARARNMTEEQVRKVVARFTEGRTLGILGEPRVNVLKLNLALDGAPIR